VVEITPLGEMCGNGMRQQRFREGSGGVRAALVGRGAGQLCHPAARAMHVLPRNKPRTQPGGHNLNSNILS